MINITWFDSNFYLQTVELDPVIVDIAKDYFSFMEDERLKVVKYAFLYFSWHIVEHKCQIRTGQSEGWLLTFPSLVIIQCWLWQVILISWFFFAFLKPNVRVLKCATTDWTTYVLIVGIGDSVQNTKTL